MSSSRTNESNGNTTLVMSRREQTNNSNGIRMRDARSRLFSDSSDEMPKSILKNRSRIPTKRSVSECVDDLAQIMADLDITLDDLSKATGKFCPHKHFFDECEEDSCERRSSTHHEEADDEEDDHDDRDSDDDDREDDDTDDETEIGTKANFKRNDGDQLRIINTKLRKCDCKLNTSDITTTNENSKPKKSVRFDEKVYETYFIASRLYDRRYIAKYHSSTRHHPPSSNSSKKQQNKKKKNKKSRNSDSDQGKSDETGSDNNNKDNNNNNGCKLTKSQRAKQSKKDKKKRLRLSKKEEGHDHGSDDQGYCSATLHSFSD